MFPKWGFLCLFTLFFSYQYILAQSNDESNIKDVINIFFEGLHAGDTLKIEEITTDIVNMQTISKLDNGKFELHDASFNDFLKNIAAINPKTTSIEEKILSYNIKVDDSMANVWTTYNFYVNAKLSHCGVNSFQIFKEDENWKIFYIIDTRRKNNCNK